MWSRKKKLLSVPLNIILITIVKVASHSGSYCIEVLGLLVVEEVLNYGIYNYKIKATLVC